MTRRLSCDEHVQYLAGCEECRRRGRTYEAQRMALLERGVRLSVAVDLTASRIRELRAAGHSLPAIAASAGVGVATLNRICNGRVNWVQLRVFHAIERVYEQRRDWPGGDVRVVTKARKRGWEPPSLPMPDEIAEEIIDPEVVRRLVNGQRVTATTAELMEAFHRLRKRNLPTSDIARRLHTTERTIERWKSGATARPGTRGRPRRTA